MERKAIIYTVRTVRTDVLFTEVNDSTCLEIEKGVLKDFRYLLRYITRISRYPLMLWEKERLSDLHFEIFYNDKKNDAVQLSRFKVTITLT